MILLSSGNYAMAQKISDDDQYVRIRKELLKKANQDILRKDKLEAENKLLKVSIEDKNNEIVKYKDLIEIQDFRINTLTLRNNEKDSLLKITNDNCNSNIDNLNKQLRKQRIGNNLKIAGTTVTVAAITYGIMKIFFVK